MVKLIFRERPGISFKDKFLFLLRVSLGLSWVNVIRLLRKSAKKDGFIMCTNTHKDAKYAKYYRELADKANKYWFTDYLETSGTPTINITQFDLFKRCNNHDFWIPKVKDLIY